MTETSTRACAAGRLLVDAVLRSYAAVLFMERRRLGAAIIALTLLDPRVAAGGLIGAVGANLLAIAFGYAPELVRTGLYGISPLLAGMGLAYFGGLSATTLVFVLPAAWFAMLLSVILTDRLYARFRIGSLSLSFALVATLGAVVVKPEGFTGPGGAEDPVSVFFSSMGAIYFLPKVLPGAILFVLLAWRSRASAVLAVLGFLVGTALFRLMGGSMADVAYGMVGLNFILAAIALGGAFLEPGPSATVHALCGAAVTAFVAVVSSRLLTPAGLPVFSWPFNLAVIGWMAALALRPSGARPAFSDDPLRAPEETARRAFLRERLVAAPGRVALPFLGEWTVTQGPLGRPTHQPPWQHAWDFEVMDAEGFPFRRGGARDEGAIRLEDYACFNAPVLAAADGLVTAASDGVPDNEPGATNTRENFGNYVVIRHEHGSTLYAHLRRGSVAVYAGLAVKAGQVIARCGASGRAPRPHLHFHLQDGDEPGSATLPVRFAAYLEREGPAGEAAYVEEGCPGEYRRVQSIETASAALHAPALEPGRFWRFSVRAGGELLEETWRTEEDLWGGVRVVAENPRAAASWRTGPAGLTVVSFEGDRSGALHALVHGLSRVPRRLLPGMDWTDTGVYALGSLSPGELLREALLPLAGLGGRPSRFRVDADANERRLAIRASTARGEIVSEWSRAEGLLRLESPAGRSLLATRDEGERSTLKISR